MQENIIRLRKGRKGRLRPGHPWIFKGQILKVESRIRPGDIVSVVNGEDKFVGRGYYNPSSEISVRLLTSKDEQIDSAFLQKKIADAISKRDHLESITDAKRLIFSEGDGLPGLIVDQYNETLVIQIFTLGMEKLKEPVLQILRDSARAKYVYEKSDSQFRKKEGLKPVKSWIGDAGIQKIKIHEGNAQFFVDIERGHKTGFYLDQRKSRLALYALAKNKRVLDLFCYTGGFTISAALGGAKSVKGVDIKDEWLELAGENAALNNVSGRVTFERGDVFEILKNVCKSGEKFDIIIIDPPSFTKDRSTVMTALKGYKELNKFAMEALGESGILATFSCSHNISPDLFSQIIKDSAGAVQKKLTILKRCHQDKDHPIVRSIPETEYLKGYFLKVG